MLFLIAICMFLLFLQCGFASLEYGAMRVKKTPNILKKKLWNMLLLRYFTSRFGVPLKSEETKKILGTYAQVEESAQIPLKKMQEITGMSGI